MELKIITFNIWDLHVGVVKDRQWRFGKLIQKIIDLDADIVCLQESWDVEHQYELRKQLTPKYYTTIGDGKIKTRNILWKKFDTAGGLIILSKFPIEDCEFIPLSRWPNTSLTEFFAKKGFLFATINTPTRSIKIINTHLQAINSKSDPIIQKRQLKGMLSRLGPAEESTPFIIIGDFNKDAMMSDPYYVRIISDHGFTEPAHFKGLGRIPTHRTRQDNIYAGTWLHPAKHPLQFDYFLLKNINMENIKIEPLYFESPLSDHDPLMLTISKPSE